MGLFCCVVAEFSYWQYFGTYIWFVIIGLRPLGQFLCAIVEEQLQEALLVMPVMTAFDMTCGVITLSCDDFVDFMVRTPCVEVEVELEVYHINHAGRLFYRAGHGPLRAGLFRPGPRRHY